MHACRHVRAPAGTTLVLLRLVMLTEMAEEKLASVKGVNAVENSVLACKTPQHAMPQPSSTFWETSAWYCTPQIGMSGILRRSAGLVPGASLELWRGGARCKQDKVAFARPRYSQGCCW